MGEPGVEKPARLWRIVLVISLALNLAIVGIVAGAAISGRLGNGPPRAFDLGLGPVARALDPAERRTIGMTLRKDTGLRRNDMRAQAALLVATLRQDPFDPDALRDLMARQGVRMANLQARAQDALIGEIVSMSPQRRVEFADQLEEELTHVRRPTRDGRSGG